MIEILDPQLLGEYSGDIVPLVPKLLHRIRYFFLKGFVFEGQTGFGFESGFNLPGKLVPPFFWQVKIRAEIEQGFTARLSIDANGFREGESLSCGSVFSAMGLCADIHERAR